MTSIQLHNVPYPDRTVQNAAAGFDCCSHFGSLLDRIAKAVSDFFSWAASFFSSQPVASTPLAQRVVNVGTEQGLLNFYQGTGPDSEGRTLTQILNWGDDQLESVHNYIQWLFPSRQASAFNARAPMLTDAHVQAFRNEPALQGNLLRSFNRMLAFYGLQEGQNQITRAPNAAARQAVWLTPGNHNFLRISRILKCLNELGLHPQAQSFYRALNDIAQHEGRSAITPRTLGIWQSAARAR